MPPAGAGTIITQSTPTVLKDSLAQDHTSPDPELEPITPTNPKDSQDDHPALPLLKNPGLPKSCPANPEEVTAKEDFEGCLTTSVSSPSPLEVPPSEKAMAGEDLEGKVPCQSLALSSTPAVTATSPDPSSDTGWKRANPPPSVSMFVAAYKFFLEGEAKGWGQDWEYCIDGLLRFEEVNGFPEVSIPPLRCSPFVLTFFVTEEYSTHHQCEPPIQNC